MKRASKSESGETMPLPARLLNAWQPPEGFLLTGTAIAVGLAAGAGVWLFKQLIGLAQRLFFGGLGAGLAGLGGWTVALVPAALSIGSGASVGPEDPSVQIGANLGSLFVQKLRLSDERAQEEAWPSGCLVASLRKGRTVLIPHGDTLLEAGDTLAVVTEGDAEEQVRRLCAASGGT